MKQNPEDTYRALASVLEKIASQREKESEENMAVRKAAWALSYIFIKGQWQHFEDFIGESETPPTQGQLDRMREHLKKIGIGPSLASED
jgi:hypothetical protein